MRSRFGLVLLLPLLAAGCARKEPSPEFSRASERFNKLYGQQLDDAFLDPGMREVEALLQRVPGDSLDAAAAQQLLKRIQDGRARMEQAARERAEAAAGARVPPVVAFSSVAPEPAPAPTPAPAPKLVPDAGGPSAPSAGMTTREFNRLFGDCFEPAGPVEVTGRGTRDSYTLSDSSRCRTAMPTLANSVVLADSQTVLGIVPRSALQRLPADGGAPGGGGVPGGGPDAAAGADAGG